MHEEEHAIRITWIKYGDCREAYERSARGGPETYSGQRYVVDFVGGLARRGGVVSKRGRTAMPGCCCRTAGST